MSSSLPVFSVAWPVFVQSFLLSLGLIVAIGAQNAFVLRQGLRREHVGSVVLFCALADALLIAAGVLGMAQALGERPLLARALALAGAGFLARGAVADVEGRVWGRGLGLSPTRKTRRHTNARDNFGSCHRNAPNW